MEDVRNEFMDAVVRNVGYDYMANNYYKFTKEELKDVILECLYTLHELKYAEDEIIDNLEERWNME